MNTFEMLLNDFGGTPTISLDQATRFFKYAAETLARKHDEGEVPLPYFRLDESQ